jgi:intracellular sulfur oxidation DsrE/DsrF family protein
MNEHTEPAPASSTNRRGFIAAVAGGTAALAASGFTARELLAQGGGFPSYPPPQNGWDTSWVEKVERAKHRMVFDMPQIESGMAFTNALTYMKGYGEVYKTPDSEFGLVVVCRHAALPAVLNDAMWAKLKYGEKNKINDPATGEPSLRNPYSKAGDKPGSNSEQSIEALMARGVTVLACNLSMMRNASILAKETGMSTEDARAAIIATLIPGVIRQPSGVFGVARAQEAGCHFLRST